MSLKCNGVTWADFMTQLVNFSRLRRKQIIKQTFKTNFYFKESLYLQKLKIKEKRKLKKILKNY